MATEEEIERQRVAFWPEVEWLPWKQAIGEADVVLVSAFDESHAKQTLEACQELLVGKVLVDCTKSNFPAQFIGEERANTKALLRYVSKVTDRAMRGSLSPFDNFMGAVFAPIGWVSDMIPRVTRVQEGADNGEDEPSGSSLVIELVHNLLDQAIIGFSHSEKSVTLSQSRPLGPYSDEDTQRYAWLYSSIRNRLKIMADLNPILYQHPVQGIIRHIKAKDETTGESQEHRLRVYFDDRCADPFCRIEMDRTSPLTPAKTL